MRHLQDYGPPSTKSRRLSDWRAIRNEMPTDDTILESSPHEFPTIHRLLPHSLQLGEGAMGNVYRATDNKPNREIAIKILPDAFAGDPDRMARFQREAKVLASLNHPNIAHIYAVESARSSWNSWTARRSISASHRSPSPSKRR